MKKLYLISPFLHKFNIDSEYYYYIKDKDFINEYIKNYTSTIDKKFTIDSLLEDKDEYISTKYDLFNIESSAILSIDVKDLTNINYFITEHKDAFTLTSVNIKIYNNNIGIITSKIKINEFPKTILKNTHNLDIITHNFMGILYAKLKEFVDDITNELKVLVLKKVNKKNKEITNIHFTKQIDSIIEEYSKKIFWTSRTIYIPNNEKLEFIEYFKIWSSSDISDINQSAFFRQGNNLVTYEYMNEIDLLNSMEFCQYYYSIFYTKNNIIKRISYLINEENIDELCSICQKFNILVKSIEINRKESISGFQGKRRQTVHEIFEKWNFYNYVEMVNDRNDLLQLKIEVYNENKKQKYRLLLEFILTSVGLISLSDFLLNIYSYISPEYKSINYSFGIFKLLSFIPSEISISLVVILTIILSMIFVSKNK